jgi:DNA gyrase/topoisomerase IV subunit A
MKTPNRNSVRDYDVKDIANNEWKAFASYTIEARAIPNIIDGLKPVQRMYLYSSIQNSAKEFKKVSAVAGVVSDYGYNHAEAAAADAGQLMAADWSNNVRLVEGRGNFGSRLVQEPGAPRYTYTRLGADFAKYIKDIELSPVHHDPEHAPPAYYLPIIPLVLVNGIRGIATGFATNILPRDPEAVANACREYLETGTIANRVAIKFPQFRGTVHYDSERDRFIARGTFVRKSKSIVEITEIPYSYDRVSYIEKVLDALEENDEIVGYSDLCDKDGFRASVKLKQSSMDWTDDQIMAKFKLEEALSENLTVIGVNGKPKVYVDERDLIKDFCDFKHGILKKRIALAQSKISEDIRWLTVKAQFIGQVIENNITFKNQKKDQVAKQILEHTDAIDEDIDRLLRISLLSLTQEMVKKLVAEIKEAKLELKTWSTTTPHKQFLLDLDEIAS